MGSQKISKKKKKTFLKTKLRLIFCAQSSDYNWTTNTCFKKSKMSFVRKNSPVSKKDRLFRLFDMSNKKFSKIGG